MKYKILSIFLILFLFHSTAEEPASQRLYAFHIYSFQAVYEIYCARTPVGYYKYPIVWEDGEVYITYETVTFYEQSRFDTEFEILTPLIPMNIWANHRGEQLRFRKRYSPCIDKNKIRKNYPYSFGKN